MAISASGVLRLAVTLTAILMGLCAAWGALALWYRTNGAPAMKALSVCLWSALSLVLLAVLWQGRTVAAAAAFAAAFGCLLAWWRRIAPSNDRMWADDVARMTSGTIDGNRATLRNVRNFDWRSDTDYSQRWETRSYDLDGLKSVDIIMSHWQGPAIAHMLISFGFETGEYVAFSVEIRREKHQTYSELGGFFKEFELSVLAADERDVIGLRTNVRGEDDYLYRVRVRRPVMRSLFLGYIGEANSLVLQPRFYHTIAVNCTTLVYHMLRRIVGPLPLSHQIIFSGYIPEYIYRVGGLDRRFPLDDLRAFGRITDRARRAGRSDTFSADIRQGIPPLCARDPPAMSGAAPVRAANAGSRIRRL